jgi:hypothetical protein
VARGPDFTNVGAGAHERHTNVSQSKPAPYPARTRFRGTANAETRHEQAGALPSPSYGVGEVMHASARQVRLLAATVVAGLLVCAAPAAATTPPTRGHLDRATARFLERERVSAGRASGGAATYTGPVLPDERVVAFYGAPQMGRTVLGLNSPAEAARKLARQTNPYATYGERPAVGEFDLVSVFATAGGGPDGLYRSRQPADVIEIYLEQARAAGVRLMLDIQPGRARIGDEMRALAPWIAQPDVDVAIDPEWNVGPRGVPGSTRGEITSREINAAIRKLSATVSTVGLPPKLLVIHQFRRGMVRGRTRIKSSPGVQAVLNFDGIGAPAPKVAGYAALASARPSVFNGFSVFYSLDRPLMAPTDVLALDPSPDFLLYQ